MTNHHVDITELINLTDLGLHNTDLIDSQVTINSSDCISCSCTCESAIVLVTNVDSCRLEHPLFVGLRSAQVNSTLEYLAVANDSKLLVIDIVDRNCHSIYTNHVKEVDLRAENLLLDHVIHWQWLDSYTLAILTHTALYACNVSIQPTIRHPAHSAIVGHVRPQLLSMCKQFDCSPRLTDQVSLVDDTAYNGGGDGGHTMKILSVERNLSANVYAITGHQDAAIHQQQHHHHSDTQEQRYSLVYSNNTVDTRSIASLSCGSNSRLSRSLTSNSLAELSSLGDNSSSFCFLNSTNSSITGLIQIHCKQRNRSQVIEAHAISFTTNTDSHGEQEAPPTSINDIPQHDEQHPSTLMIVANRIAYNNSIKVYYIEMSESPLVSSSLLNLSQQIAMPSTSAPDDVPVAIECSLTGNQTRQIAFIITRHGLMNICDIHSASLLSQVSLTNTAPDLEINMNLSRAHEASFLRSTLIVDKESSCPSVMLIEAYTGRVLLCKVRADRLAANAAAFVAKRHVSAVCNSLTTASSRCLSTPNIAGLNYGNHDTTDESSGQSSLEITRL